MEAVSGIQYRDEEESFEETRESGAWAGGGSTPPGRPCTLCRHYATCAEPCVYVDRIAGGLDDDEDRHVDLNEERMPQRYREVIDELRQGVSGRRKVDIGRIRGIEDIRLRAVAAMIYARLNMKDIARVLEKSESQIYRLIHKG
jgi:hypothetical protein